MLLPFAPGFTSAAQVVSSTCITRARASPFMECIQSLIIVTVIASALSLTSQKFGSQCHHPQPPRRVFSCCTCSDVKGSVATIKRRVTTYSPESQRYLLLQWRDRPWALPVQPSQFCYRRIGRFEWPFCSRNKFPNAVHHDHSQGNKYTPQRRVARLRRSKPIRLPESSFQLSHAEHRQIPRPKDR